MRALEILGKSFLLEADLTKGAKFVLNDKKVVANVADMLRMDNTLPQAQRIKFRRLPDMEVATWFVQQLDNMEKQGLGGVIFSRDGKNHFWIAKSYGNGGELWEDIEGEYPEAMRDYTILKNRNMLDPKHSDIQKFRGVKELHRYMVVHYEEMLKDLRKDAELASLIKNKRSVQIVDNDDYGIWLLQNRGAACAFGKGATYCTANSRTDVNWKSYSAAASIFGMVPKIQAEISGASENPEHSRAGALTGLKEKFQFDAGSRSFKDPLDKQVSPTLIHERFPYLWTDLVKGIKEHKAEIEEPEIEAGVDKLKYNIDKEIGLLKTNLAQYWTDKVRPKPKPEGEEGETLEIVPDTVPSTEPEILLPPQQPPI